MGLVMLELSVFCVEMNVRVLSMFYGSVLLIRIRGKGFVVKLRATLGEAFNDFDVLDSI